MHFYTPTQRDKNVYFLPPPASFSLLLFHWLGIASDLTLHVQVPLNNEHKVIHPTYHGHLSLAISNICQSLHYSHFLVLDRLRWQWISTLWYQEVWLILAGQ